MPISRRFLVASSIVRLLARARGDYRIVEGYFSNQPGRNSHVTLAAETGTLVLETGADEMRKEERTDIPKPHAEALLDVASGLLEYARSRLTNQGCELFLDRFEYPPGLHLVTVAAEDAETASRFQPLLWLGDEVTSDPAYQNRAMALEEPPAVQDVPLSNGALDQFLDLLEGGTTSTASQLPELVTHDERADTAEALRRFADAFGAVRRAEPDEERATSADKSEAVELAAVLPERIDMDDDAIRALAWSLRPRSSRAGDPR
jgi:CYTH domain-containing protein